MNTLDGSVMTNEITKYAAVAGAIAAAVQTDQVQALISQLEAHEWIGAVVSAVAVVKFIAAQIGKGQGDDPKSTSLKGVFKNGG